MHAVGQELGIPQLAALSSEQNSVAFITAKSSSLEGAIWNIFHMTGFVESDEVDRSSEAYTVLLAIEERKKSLHVPILQEFGPEVPGAAAFIKATGQHGLRHKQAIATQAVPTTRVARDDARITAVEPDFVFDTYAEFAEQLGIQAF